MREYEVTIILQPEIKEEEQTELLSRIQSWLTPDEENAEQITVDHWGLRQLAYPINKFTQGYYVFYNGQLDPSRVSEIERNMEYNEVILRYLVIRKNN